MLQVPSPNSTGEESSGQLPGAGRQREGGILTFRLKISFDLILDSYTKLFGKGRDDLNFQDQNCI